MKTSNRETLDILLKRVSETLPDGYSINLHLRNNSFLINSEMDDGCASEYDEFEPTEKGLQVAIEQFLTDSEVAAAELTRSKCQLTS